MKGKKVLIILNDLIGGGIQRIFVNIANDFAEAGLETELLLGKKYGVYFDMLKPGIPVHELNAVNLFQYIRKLPAFLKDKDYTHIFTASDYISVATVLAKKKLKFPAKIIATLHYNLPYQLSIIPQTQRAWIKYLNRHYISKADEIVAVSNGVADGFRKIVGNRKTDNLRTIYNPVFDDSLYAMALEKVEEDYFEKGMITLINVARLQEQKNQRLLINAFQILSRQKDNLQLLIAGTGALEQELRNQINELGLQEKIYLIGFKQNPFAYIAKSDLFVLSSSSEGLPTAIIESLALGINVVSTYCGAEEILEDGKFGWLAENNNAELLAAGIKNALLHKHDTKFLQERAMLFHKKNIIPQYFDLIR
ncbi:MAG TPA: glycosyltransferase [Chitinophagaceae bacterium]|nr:glycosyltransferase [Chitinophagaceae bacterium]